MSTFHYPHQTNSRVSSIEKSIHGLLSQKLYPCTAAVQSYFKDEYRVGIYKQFGHGRYSYELARDLLKFREEYKISNSPYLSFWAVFEDSEDLSEAEFETCLWNELSYTTSHPEFNSSWDPNFSSDPEDKNFCFSLDGTAFFVVGLHPHSSRISRRFPHPTLIFNVYDQFRDLAAEGKYVPMVETNRKRDLRFQGSVNPMVEAYGDTWEPIQFSGKKNEDGWKCPFRHGLKPESV
jgi:hypothetical protein